MTPRKASAALPALLATALLAAGCCPSTPEEPLRPAIGYELTDSADLVDLGRVAFIELDHRGSYSGVSREISSALFRAVQGKRLFHVRQVERTDPSCRDLPLGKHGPFEVSELHRMRQALDCDAVLVGAVTDFQAHPRMQVGLYLNLLDLRDGRLIWGVDHLWDSSDREVEARLRAFFRDQMGSGYDPADWRLGLMSPKLFSKFVAHEAAGTLRASRDDHPRWKGEAAGPPQAPRRRQTKEASPTGDNDGEDMACKDGTCELTRQTDWILGR